MGSTVTEDELTQPHGWFCQLCRVALRDVADGGKDVICWCAPESLLVPVGTAFPSAVVCRDLRSSSC